MTTGRINQVTILTQRGYPRGHTPMKGGKYKAVTAKERCMIASSPARPQGHTRRRGCAQLIQLPPLRFPVGRPVRPRSGVSTRIKGSTIGFPGGDAREPPHAEADRWPRCPQRLVISLALPVIYRLRNVPS